MIKRLNEALRVKCGNLVEFILNEENIHYIVLPRNNEDVDKIIELCKFTPGINSVYPSYVSELSIDAIAETCIKNIPEVLKNVIRD